MIARNITDGILESLSDSPVVLLVGARQVAKVIFKRHRPCGVPDGIEQGRLELEKSINVIHYKQIMMVLIFG